MDILTAHRERVSSLRETLERLIGVNRRLYELRSNSWREQLEGDPDREDTLLSMHRQIDDLEAEAELMRDVLRESPGEPAHEPDPPGSEAAPARSTRAAD